MKISIINKVTLGFGLTLLILIVISVISYRSSIRHDESSRLVTHTYKVIAELEKLLSLAKDTETGSRGLMDMQMPVMDGYAAAKEIRRWEAENKRAPMPIIALTAYALAGDAEKSIEAGCNAHIPKPVKKAELLETVERYAKGQ